VRLRIPIQFPENTKANKSILQEAISDREMQQSQKKANPERKYEGRHNDVPLNRTKDYTT